jgi:hypothetical protein
MPRAVGEIARRYETAIAQSKAAGRRPARGAIDRGRGRTERDRPPHQIIYVPLLVNVQGVAVVGAEAEKRRSELVDQWDQRREILGGRTLADQHLHAFRKLFAAFIEAGGLVTVAHAAGKIGIQRSAGQQRRVAIDMRALERRQLIEALGVLVQHARHVHELGEPDHLRMIAVGH